MAASGNPVNVSVVVAAKRDEVIQRISQSCMGSPGGSFDSTTVTTDGQTFLNGTRKYMPTWALVVAILGALLFLIGLIALVVRNTETFSVHTSDVEGGTRVTVSGVASPTLAASLSSAITSFPKVAS